MSIRRSGNAWLARLQDALSRILLTASGGPFRGKSAADLAGVTVAQALRHPTWSMGGKITIDSATLMNKGLEVIEASWLFDCPVDQIEVVVHPQSIIHSMVELTDGSVLAQMGFPDMKLPIQLALTWPQRLPGSQPHYDPFDPRTATLTFERPDRQTFRLLDLAYQASRRGGSLPAVLNTANEAAVELVSCKARSVSLTLPAGSRPAWSTTNVMACCATSTLKTLWHLTAGPALMLPPSQPPVKPSQRLTVSDKGDMLPTWEYLSASSCSVS